MGVDCAETDIRYTADKVFVNSHDAGWNRVFGVRKRVIHTTWAEARTYRALHGGQHPTRLVRSLHAVKRRDACLMTEIKAQWPEERLTAFVNLVRSRHVVHNLIIFTASERVMRWFADNAANFTTVWKATRIPTAGDLLDMRPDGVLLQGPMSSDRLTRRLHRHDVFTITNRRWNDALHRHDDALMIKKPKDLARALRWRDRQ
jgi:glycerophosphoryl diester phosphodiesterase